MDFKRLFNSNISSRLIHKKSSRNHIMHSSPHIIKNKNRTITKNKTDIKHSGSLSEKVCKPNIIDCVKCWNKGKYLTVDGELCDSCAGTGRKSIPNLWSEPCTVCNGNGKIIDCRLKICECGSDN